MAIQWQWQSAAAGNIHVSINYSILSGLAIESALTLLLHEVVRGHVHGIQILIVY